MSAGTKRPYAEVFPVAQRIVEKLMPYCERIELAGSLRRGRPMVSDIEIVALPKRIKNLFGQEIDGADTELDAFLYPRVEFTKNGGKYKQFTYGSHRVDLFLPASVAHWGSIFMIRTGSHDFNLWVQTVVAPAAGIQFSGGLLYAEGAQLYTPEESSVFYLLGLPWIPPHHRDGEKWLEYKTEVQHA